MKILGLDHGYNYIKTSKDVCFASSVMKGNDDFNKVLQVNIGNENYIVGEKKGRYITDLDKTSTDENIEHLKVTTLTSIALSYPDEAEINLNICVGLPVARIAAQKEEFREQLLNMSDEVILNNSEFKQIINIKEVIVVPQAVGYIIAKGFHDKSISNESNLIFDIGGGTIDVCYFEGLKLIDKATYDKGTLILYSQLAQHMNNEYCTKVRSEDIFKFMKRGYFTLNGDKVSTLIFNEIIKNYVSELMQDVSRNFDASIVDNCYIIGGGAEMLGEYIKDYIKTTEIISNSQFVNAKAFSFLGELKLNNENKEV